jgi:hypothetical protein
MKKFGFTLAFATISQISFGASWTGSEILMYSIVGLCIFLSIVALILVATNMMNLEATRHGLDVTKENYSAVPGFDDFARPGSEDYNK